MSRRDTTPFQKTRLALAVAALSASLGACSTVPRDDGFGGTVAGTDRTTAEAGPGLWDRTMYLLGFGETAGTEKGGRRDGAEPTLAAANDTRRLDEVDIAMAKEDAVMPSSRATDVISSPAWADTAAAADRERSDEELFDGERVLVENRVDGEPLPVSGSELTHEVGASETLWDIAKKTTGDATNWHVLADVNDLAPDAGVYPGQTIVVPADMVRPELVGFTTTAEADAAATTPIATADVVTDPAVEATPEQPATEAEILAAGVLAEVDAATGGTELRLAAGETLWDFAKRTTGDATNWRAIADANGFSEEQATKVYENMRITVPTALLRDDTPDGGTIEASEPLDVAGATDAASGTDDDAPARIVDADGAADALDEVATAAPATDDAGTPRTGAEAPDADQPIRIVEAAYRADTDDLVSGTATTDAAAALSVAEGTGPEEIMVSGTYYPKAVYNDADFSSSLLMRVSPGTKLLVSRAVGSWYEVATDQGTGYVHARDIK